MVEYDLSEEGMLMKAQSVETHRMSLEAQPDVGSQVESLFVLEHTGSDEKSVKQLIFKSLDEAIESLLEWYRVFEINGDVDGVISESRDQTVRFIYYHFKRVHSQFATFSVNATSFLLCQRFVR